MALSVEPSLPWSLLRGHAAAAEVPAPFARPGFDVAPPLALPALAASSPKLSDQRGSVVLLHFFATWCEPCREEFASLGRLLAAHSNDLAVLSVSVGEVAVRVRKFMETVAPGFPVLLDEDRRAAKAWGVVSLPTTFILDADLRPRLVVEKDLDWMRDEVRLALQEIRALPEQEASHGAKGRKQ